MGDRRGRSDRGHRSQARRPTLGRPDSPWPGRRVRQLPCHRGDGAGRRRPGNPTRSSRQNGPLRQRTRRSRPEVCTKTSSLRWRDALRPPARSGLPPPARATAAKHVASRPACSPALRNHGNPEAGGSGREDSPPPARPDPRPPGRRMPRPGSRDQPAGPRQAAAAASRPRAGPDRRPSPPAPPSGPQPPRPPGHAGPSAFLCGASPLAGPGPNRLACPQIAGGAAATRTLSRRIPVSRSILALQAPPEPRRLPRRAGQ